MVLIVNKKGCDSVRIEEENLKEWEGYGYSLEAENEDPKDNLIERAIELKIASPSIIKRMSLEKLTEKIVEAEEGGE